MPDFAFLLLTQRPPGWAKKVCFKERMIRFAKIRRGTNAFCAIDNKVELNQKIQLHSINISGEYNYIFFIVEIIGNMGSPKKHNIGEKGRE
jgi:hypothetical protein